MKSINLIFSSVLVFFFFFFFFLVFVGLESVTDDSYVCLNSVYLQG